MKNWKEIWQGLSSLFMLITGTLLGMLEHFWKSRSEAQKSVMIAVAIVLIALGGWSVAHAENNPNSNFGAFATDDGRTVYMCYMASDEAKVGTVYTCLIMHPMMPGVLGADGQVTYCTITSYKADKPYASCGQYDDMRKVSGGV